MLSRLASNQIFETKRERRTHTLTRRRSNPFCEGGVLTFLNTHLAFLDRINQRTSVYVNHMRRFVLVVSMIMATAFQLCVSNGVRGFQQKVESVVGAVADIDKSSRRATIKTDTGETITVKTDDNSVFLRILAGEKT